MKKISHYQEAIPLRTAKDENNDEDSNNSDDDDDDTQ